MGIFPRILVFSLAADFPPHIFYRVVERSAHFHRLYIAQNVNWMRMVRCVAVEEILFQIHIKAQRSQPSNNYLKKSKAIKHV